MSLGVVETKGQAIQNILSRALICLQYVNPDL